MDFVRQMTDEIVDLFHVNDVFTKRIPMISNIPFLVSIALAFPNEHIEPLKIIYT